MLDNQNSWSEWIDCNENTIATIPQSSGVFMMHSSMKILFIEGSNNLKKIIEEKLSLPCITPNIRLRYMKTPAFEKISEELIQDYKARHEGNMPSCM